MCTGIKCSVSFGDLTDWMCLHSSELHNCRFERNPSICSSFADVSYLLNNIRPKCVKVCHWTTYRRCSAYLTWLYNGCSGCSLRSYFKNFKVEDLLRWRGCLKCVTLPQSGARSYPPSHASSPRLHTHGGGGEAGVGTTGWGAVAHIGSNPPVHYRQVGQSPYTYLPQPFRA